MGAANWSVETEILAGIHDHLAVANRQRATKGPKPKPLPRPKDLAVKSKTFTSMTLDDLDAFLGWESPRS